MSKKGDAQKQVRLEPDIHAALRDIQKNCDWPVSLAVLASFAARQGLSKTRKTFDSKRNAI